MKNSNIKLFTIFFVTVMTTSSLIAGIMGFPTVDQYNERSYQYGVKLAIPDFPETPEGIESTINEVIDQMMQSGDGLAELESGKLTFKNTFQSLDHISHQAACRAFPIYLIKNTSPDEALRKAATDAMMKYQKALIEFNFREDIYLNLRAFADSEPSLEGEDKKLFDDTLLEYKRLGYDLAIEDRVQAEALQKELAQLNNDFSDNIRNYKKTLTFTKDELKGLSESFLTSVQNDEGAYVINPNIRHHATNIYQFADSEETRKKVFSERFKIAQDSNTKLLKKMIRARHQLAVKLGYKTWADYKTEPRMAGTGDTVASFLADLVEKLEPKFQQEHTSLRSLKVADTGNPEAELNIWDVNYYQEKQNKLKYNIDTEKLKQYFPYERCLDGLFEVYETVFSITITEIENPTLWDPEVTLYAVSDTSSEKPLGLLYIDPFPREGKFNHFAQFTVIPAAELEDGIYQRPTVALVCNFPPPGENQPSLLTFDNVETLFHEFGHAMHSILTQAKYYSHAGTSVPQDFVETPSQVMEYWLTDKKVLDLFAADWRDQSKKIPEEWVKKIAESQKANAGMMYRRQLAIGSLDMAIHHISDPEIVSGDFTNITNGIIEKTYFKSPENTSWITGIGHMAGYDAGYYGYAWADVIAADFAKSFENSNSGFMNPELGMKLRKEIFEVGNSRNVNESTKIFLGRESEMGAFIESLGIESKSIESPKDE